MSDPHFLELTIPSQSTPAELAEGLEQALGLRPAGRHRSSLVYYDSFDWRLRRSGFEFAVELADTALSAILAGPGGERHEPVGIAIPPRFAQDLPAAAWRGRVAELLYPRALLPRVEISLAREEFLLEGEEGILLLRAVLESPALDRAGNPLPLTARLRLDPIKGHRKTFRHIAERLRREFGLEPAESTLLSEALAASGITPADPSALPCIRFDPKLRADAAAKQILTALSATLAINEAGTRAETDIEFLHDFRVAVRRTRAALGQIKEVFPDATVRRYASGFGELGRITGEPRDLDVYLLDFERHREELPLASRPALDPLRALLASRSEAAHARLNSYLESSAYRRLIQGWERFLSLPVPRRPRSRNAAVPIRELADRRIWKLYRRVVEDGLAIAAESPAEQVHELRKTAKKLRYLMEFFRGLYPPEKIAPLIKILKGLQEHLGEYQDAHAQIAQLMSYADELRQTGAPTATLLALGALLDRRYVWEGQLREGFPECFAEFAEESHRRKFRHLFKPAAADAGPSK